VRIENAADYPEFIGTIARWHWDAWGDADPAGSLEAWTAGLQTRANRACLPMTFVALDERGAPLGSVTIVEHDMPDRADLRHLTPWIAGTFVLDSERRKGIGTALMRHAVTEASRLGVCDLFLYASSARRFYERLGWTAVRNDYYEGESVTIMTLRVIGDFANAPSTSQAVRRM